MIIWLRLE